MECRQRGWGPKSRISPFLVECHVVEPVLDVVVGVDLVVGGLLLEPLRERLQKERWNSSNVVKIKWIPAFLDNNKWCPAKECALQNNLIRFSDLKLLPMVAVFVKNWQTFITFYSHQITLRLTWP